MSGAENASFEAIFNQKRSFFQINDHHFAKTGSGQI
jgi:hypothetical protein